MKTFVIAEIGVNHNGRLDLAMQLVEAAAGCGAHAAKFQTFSADALTVRNAASVAYQRDRSGATDQHEMLKRLELSVADHQALARRCGELGIEFMSTAFDLRSLDMLCDLGIRRIKVPSGELTNTVYLKACAAKGLPIILSTGMADLSEVEEAVGVVRATPAFASMGAQEPLTVLHCTSAYPTAFADANLLAMNAMQQALGVPVGLSDHTVGITAAPVAVAMGARVIEKHITLDRTLPGPDHFASIEPGEFAAMMRAIADVEALRGDGIKRPREAELEARALVRRGLKAARDMAAGTVMTASDIDLLRPATGLAPVHFEATVGRTLARPLAAGEPITAADLA